MDKHIKKIQEGKLIYGMNIAFYIIFMILNIDTLLDSKVREMGYSFVAAIIFTILFAFMIVAETIFQYLAKKFLQDSQLIFVYGVFRVLLFAVYYFVVPVQVGAAACLVGIILFSIQLLFQIQFDERPRRLFMYVVLGIPLESATLWFMVSSSNAYQGVQYVVSGNVALICIILICEILAKTYNYFIHLLFAQNRTVDNLNEVNEKLKEQQEEIKKTNELLGMQKIELQAANKKINRSHDEMSVQNEISGAITSTMQIDDLLQKVCHVMRVRLNLDLAGIVIEPDEALSGIGESKRAAHFSSTLGNKYVETTTNRILTGEMDDILELSNTYIQNTETGYTGVNHNVDENCVLESVVVVPLKKQEERIGNMIIGKRNINAFMDNRAFYENIASQISIGISNMQLYEQMRNMAIRDGLTHIYNRRHLTKLIDEYFSNAMKKKTSVCLALFDIDKFKMVNDTYGHQCGDVVICHVATLLNRFAVENGGIAGRYGGEEFVIAFEGKDLKEVTEIVTEVHAKIKAEEVAFEDKVLNVSASAGVAAYPETCQNPAELLTRADWAMYHSKRNGRDRITIDSDELETIM